MTEREQHIQEAIQDLQIIRRAIDRAKKSEEGLRVLARTVWETNLVIQGVALIMALGLLIMELVEGHANTKLMLIAGQDAHFGIISIGSIALWLSLLCASMYFIIYRASKNSKRDFGDFIARNFVYLKNISFLSDLVVKFIFVSLLILAGKPEWISPVFLVFIGDYLIQGRFFTIPLRESLALGVICFICAAVQFFAGSALLVWPLAVYVIVNAVSVGQMCLLRRETTTLGNEEQA